MNTEKRGTGALKSPLDVRTFSYRPTGAGGRGGERWTPEDIEDQHRVGICTAISMTMRARKHYGVKFSADFQYMMQKRLYDSQSPIGWGEGSSAFHSLKVGKNIGFLPESEWTHTTENDRKRNYFEYKTMLKNIPDEEVERLVKIAGKYKLEAFAKIPNTADAKHIAIDEGGAIISRFVIGNKWWTTPVDPLTYSSGALSGHLVNESNYAGLSFRIPNSWGKDWNGDGSAYYLWNQYQSTESWQVWFEDVELPEEIKDQIESRDSIVGKILDYLQKIIVLVAKLK